VSLLVAIHDVAPGHLATVQHLRERLADWGVERVTLLAVPDYHGDGRLQDSPATVAWLRARADAGDEVCLHGHFHMQLRAIRGRVDRARARLWTAGEGECLAQGEGGRRRMLWDEKRGLEDLIGRAVVGFVAPAWLEPRGFAATLTQAGFRWHEGGTWVERLSDGHMRSRRWRLPVVGFATRTTARRVTSIVWSRAATALAQRATRLGLAPARVALHPADAASPAVMAAAEASVRRLLQPHGSATYATALKISATRRDVHAAL